MDRIFLGRRADWSNSTPFADQIGKSVCPPRHGSEKAHSALADKWPVQLPDLFLVSGKVIALH